ncbi:MAG: TetR/AcrR family transcriptional regulator [Xanthomonadales bacterium]|nr:TetR/AcrR family transcriptional regulator [Xanthomonadales bacterium]
MTVGRPRKFNPDDIVRIAIDVFWKKGYEQTSVADLLKATGLHKGSLYQTFGDKKTLFKAALNTYYEDIYTKHKNIINSEPDPLIGLKKSFKEVLSYSGTMGDQSNRGCMVVNAIVETVPNDAEIKALAERQFQRFNSLILGVLVMSESNGRKFKYPPEMTIGLLMTLMTGLSVNLKDMINLEQANQILEAQFELLGL